MGHGGDAGELQVEATVDAEPLLCRVLGVVVHGWGVLGSRSLRVRFTMHELRTYSCKFFSFVQKGTKAVPPKRPVPGPQRVYSRTCDVCNTCALTYSSRSGFEMLFFRGGGGGKRGERKTKRGNISFSKTKKKQRDLNSLLESYETYLRSQCATVPVLHDAAHF